MARKAKKVEPAGPEVGSDAWFEAEVGPVISDFTKKFGKGAVMTLDGQFSMKDTRKEYDIIPTGSMQLDTALGVGGLPLGRVVEIFGAESSGKCLPAGTYIKTPDGTLTVEELFAQKGLLASCKSATTPAAANLYNRWGAVEPTTHFTHNNRKLTYETVTASGGKVRSTANHPHLVMSAQGNWVWRKTHDLRTGDYLVVSRVPRTAGSLEVDDDEAYMVGLLVADGYFGKQRLGVTNDDPCIKRFIEEQMPGLLGGVAPKQYANGEGGRSVNYHFNSKEGVGTFYAGWGFQPCTSPNKVLPESVRSLVPDNLVEFLRGYFDCECSVDVDRATIEVTSASEQLLREVRLLLLDLGIVSLLRTKKVKAYPDNVYWRLAVSGDEAREFVRVVGTRSAARMRQYVDLVGQPASGGSTNHDSVPHLGHLLRDLYDSAETTREDVSLLSDYMGTSPRAQVTYERLDKIIAAFAERPCAETLLSRLQQIAVNRYYYDRIESVEEYGEEPTFDFAMASTASFIANGFVTHNTTLTLHVIANAQARGYTCAFIDAEHALDYKYSQALGVKLDRLLFSQPDSGEQALQIVDELVDSGKVQVIVVDSVAALVPEQELNGEIGDHAPGAQARLMSQALRRMTMKLAEANCLLIFINQTRMKIGVTFGSPVTTSGGKALRFYASIRMDIARIGSLKETGGKKEAKANKTRVKVVKNKVAPPFRTAEFDIVFGTGIDTYGELVDLGVEHGFLIKSGAWYKRKSDESLVGQGRDAARRWLQENPDEEEKLRASLPALP